MRRKRYEYPQIQPQGGCYTLEQNDVWNVPDQDTHGKGSYRAVAIDSDGYVFGERQLSNLRECGHELEGSVSVCGKKYRAFTSSKLFQHPSGRLVSVAVLYVCIDDEEPIPLPPLATASAEQLKAIVDRYFYCREGSRAAIKDYCQMRLWINSGDYPHAFNAERLNELAEELPEWVCL